MKLLETHNIVKSFAQNGSESTVISNVSMAVEKGAVAALLGPSGCGKTTLLRIIAGLDQPDAGQIIFNGKNVTNVPSHKRGFGMMFQDYALFPHKNVGSNVAFGLEMKNSQIKPQAINTRVNEVLETVGLAGFAERRVDELSGGERQRVALARCLAPEPELLMLDEPLGALDRELRDRLMPEIRALLKNSGTTGIFVTHDQTEAFSVADTISVMSKGRLLKIASPEVLYNDPEQEETARFLGFRNIFPFELEKKFVSIPGIGRLLINQEPPPVSGHQHMKVLIRPESAGLCTGSHVQGDNMVSGKIFERTFRGGFFSFGLETDAKAKLYFTTHAGNRPPGIGEAATCNIDPEGIRILSG